MSGDVGPSAFHMTFWGIPRGMIYLESSKRSFEIFRFHLSIADIPPLKKGGRGDLNRD
jgi:hypothetical protein